jgi:ankyrin repeat protein
MACDLLDRALAHAVISDDLGSTYALLTQGANANVRTDEDQTVLMWAAAYGRTALVQALMEWGADLHQRDRRGQTALMKAVQHGHRDVVQALKQGGARE